MDGDHRQGARPVARRRADRRRPRSARRPAGATAASWSRASPTAIANGQARFPDEIELLEQLGLENLDAIENAIHRYDIDCDFERTGVIDVATDAHAPSYLDELRDDAVQLQRLGQDASWLDAEAMRAEVDSPTYTGGLWRIGRAALVDPARLAWGLKSAAERLGVRIYEDTKATELERDGVGVLVHTPLADVRAARVALGTNAFKPLLRRLRHYVVPVYDYCMVTEPLTPEQRASIGWGNRQGLSDIPNQFHYYRLTEDNRILWGGYDAVYYWRGKVASELESRPETWATLSRHFFETFPQLEDVRFSHIWGGAIDTCSRFCVFWGTAMSGRVAYAARLHRPRRGVDPVRRRGDARPARRPAQRRRRRPTSCGASRCRSRPSRSASSASRRPAGRSAARTAPAGATSGCAPSTASASASTPDVRPSPTVSAAIDARRSRHDAPSGGRRRRWRRRSSPRCRRRRCRRGRQAGVDTRRHGPAAWTANSSGSHHALAITYRSPTATPATATRARGPARRRRRTSARRRPTTSACDEDRVAVRAGRAAGARSAPGRRSRAARSQSTHDVSLSWL